MNEAVLLIAALLILVVALMALNRSVRRWVFKVMGIESIIESPSHQIKVTARNTSKVEKIINEGGNIDADARDNSEIKDVKNIQK